MALSHYTSTSLGRIFLLFRARYMLQKKLVFAALGTPFGFAFIMKYIYFFLAMNDNTLRMIENSFHSGEHFFFFFPLFVGFYAVFYYFRVSHFCNNRSKEVPATFLLPLSNTERFLYLLFLGVAMLALSVLSYYLFTLLSYLPLIGKEGACAIFTKSDDFIFLLSQLTQAELLRLVLPLLFLLDVALVPLYACIKMANFKLAILLSFLIYIIFYFLRSKGSYLLFAINANKLLTEESTLMFDIGISAFIAVVLLFICFRAVKNKELK